MPHTGKSHQYLPMRSPRSDRMVASSQKAIADGCWSLRRYRFQLSMRSGRQIFCSFTPLIVNASGIFALPGEERSHNLYARGALIKFTIRSPVASSGFLWRSQRASSDVVDDSHRAESPFTATIARSHQRPKQSLANQI